MRVHKELRAAFFRAVLGGFVDAVIIALTLWLITERVWTP